MVLLIYSLAGFLILIGVGLCTLGYSFHPMPGMLQFSNIVFNKEKNKALVFIRWFRSKLNGNESIAIFHLENGKWVDKEGFELSIS